MRNTVLGIIAMSLLMITACKKTSSTNLGGTWTFQTVNYTATSFATGYGLITVTNQPTAYSTEYTTLTVNFYGGLPTQNSFFTSGTFNVVKENKLDSTDQVSLDLNIAGASGNTLYRSTGSGANQTVNVSVSNGKLTITGSGVELANVLNAADSAALNLDLIQP